MPKKKSRISFDYEYEPEQQNDLENELVMVNQNYFLRYVRTIAGVKRFNIPTQIKKELNLKVKDDVYFVEYDIGYYIVFNQIPDTSTYKRRKLISAGAGDSLYVAIPPFITKQYDSPITYIRLIRPEGVPNNTWRIQFSFTDCT